MRPPPHSPVTHSTSSLACFSSLLCPCQACDFSQSGLETKALLCLSLCLGWGGFQQLGKVVALQILEGVGMEGGLNFFNNKYKEGLFFGWVEIWMGERGRGSRAALSDCVSVYWCQNMPYGDHRICGWRVSYLCPPNCKWRDTYFRCKLFIESVVCKTCVHTVQSYIWWMSACSHCKQLDWWVSIIWPVKLLQNTNCKISKHILSPIFSTHGLTSTRTVASIVELSIFQKNLV